jgi:hypothetical protein
MASRVSVRVPIWLTLIRIELARAELDALGEVAGVGHEEIVADELDLVADGRRLSLPAVPVVFVEAVLDAHDRVLLDHLGPEVDQLVAVSSPASTSPCRTYFFLPSS